MAMDAVVRVECHVAMDAAVRMECHTWPWMQLLG